MFLSNKSISSGKKLRLPICVHQDTFLLHEIHWMSWLWYCLYRFLGRAMFICTTIFFLCFFVVSRYELLFGVTSADAAFAFNNRQLEYGLEPEERNRIFSEFVSTNYGLHQREIFASIVNEYTDWQSAAQHPVNIRDKTLEALNDAHYVAPLVETGDYHSSLNARSWFYVFDYQTKNSYYKQVYFFCQSQVLVLVLVLTLVIFRKLPQSQ